MIATLAIAFVGTRAALPDVTLAGVKWYGNPATAARIAAQQKKPVLVLDMFGRLDETFC